MEGLCTMLPVKRRKSKMKRRAMGIINSIDATHEGIKTVEVENTREFLGRSDVCICIVTWNMNGQVSYQDTKKPVGENRKFDILVVGLQEAPRDNILQLLKKALVDTHMSWNASHENPLQAPSDPEMKMYNNWMMTMSHQEQFRVTAAATKPHPSFKINNQLKNAWITSTPADTHVITRTFLCA